MARRPPGEAPPSPPTAPRPGADPDLDAGSSHAPAPRSATHALPDWFDPSLPLRHDDTSARVVLLPDDAEWQPARRAGLEMRVLEHLGGDGARLTAQLRLARGASTAPLGDGAGLELLVQRGEIDVADSVWPAGLYVRLPVAGAERFDSLVLHADEPSPGGEADEPASEPGALLYVATGHIAEDDTEQRRIDTSDEECWLPGPVNGTEVMPLHVHGSANSMLIRWLGAVAFRPKLDPRGEEVLVLEGCLHDATGDYPAGSWIRNPVPAWQSWSGEPGTLVYYKSGHFAAPLDEGAAPAPAGE